jgi:hypothetical protein
MDCTGRNDKNLSQLDALMFKIRQKAAREGDVETYGWADSMDVLIQDLSVGMQFERESRKS